MITLNIFLSVWHPTLKAKEIVSKIRFDALIAADRGEQRGTSGATFPETYCHFKVGEMEMERECEIVQHLIVALQPLDELNKLIASGGRVWVTAKIPSEIYELSISPDEIRKFSDCGLGVSFHIS